VIVEPLRRLERAVFPVDLELGVPPWDGLCAWCGSTIDLADTYTFWSLHGIAQYLHLACQRTYAAKLASELARLEVIW
jgi:hypothetical protein